MEWIDRLNNAVHYMERNMQGTIEVDEVAKIACCSTYQLQNNNYRR